MEVDGGVSSKKPRSKKRDKPTHASSSKEKHCSEGEQGNVSESKQEGPSKPSTPPKDKKDKAKAKPRKKRSVSPVMVEDIIDGFAFASFKSFEDLEMTVKAAAQEKQNQQQNNHVLPVMPSIGQVTVTVTHTVTHPAMNHSGTTPVTILASTTVPQATLLTVNSPSFTSPTITSCHTSSSSPIASKVMAPINHYDFDSHIITELPNHYSLHSVPKVNKVKKDVPKKPKKDKVSHMQSALSPNNKTKVSSSVHSIVPHTTSSNHKSTSLTTATTLVSSITASTPVTSVVPVTPSPTISALKAPTKEDKPHRRTPDSVPIKVEPSPTCRTNTVCDRSSSRDRLSDVSTHSSSGKGYLGESESGDNGASDAESEKLFNPTHKKSVPPHLAVSLPVRTCTPAPSQCLTFSHQAKPITTVTPSPVGNAPSRHSRSPRTPTPQTHRTTIHREVPKPIPGISGSRTEDRKSVTPVSASKPHSSWNNSSAAASHYSSVHRSPSNPSLSLPLRRTPTPSLHPLGPPLTPHHHPPNPPPAHTHHHNNPQNMFPPPLGPPAAPSLSSTPLPVPGGMHAPFPGTPDSTSPFQQSQELIRRELDRQFLDRLHQDRLPTPGTSLPSYIHQHQHQHMHQHQHTHFGPTYPPGLPGSLVPPGASHLFEKNVPKFDSPFYRPSVPGLPAYTGLAPFIQSGPGPTPHLGSGIHGAFQPKNLSGNMHHSQLLINHVTQRDREKNAATGPSTPAPPNKKSGKWCAMHVRVAWEIYHHQQKQQADAQKGTPDGKGAADPLRPPSHLLPGSSLHRSPAELAATPTLFGPRTSGVPPFPRPSPYGGLGTGLGSFGGLGGSLLGGRDLPGMPVMTSPHEWNRLHRTPPSFPTPPAWPKSDLEREKEKDREREREREQREKEREDREKREIDREKDREKESRDLERERERDKPPEIDRGPIHVSSSRSSPVRDYRTNGIIDSDSDKHTTVRHRSRSRSPVRNGPTEEHHRDTSSRDSAFKNDIRVKEERKEEHNILNEVKDKRTSDIRNDIMRSDLRNDLMNSHSVASLLPPNALQLLESRRMLSLAGYPAMLERPPNPLWNPLDRGLDLTHHRLEFQREMEHQRERMLQRFPPTLGAMMEHENRIREQQEIQLRERANIEARLAQMDRERILQAEMERAKLPLFRPGELAPPSGLYSAHTRGMSPAVNHNHTSSNSKSNSPSTNPTGVPPPLIPSSATLNSSHSHSNSPSLTKASRSSPAPEVAPPEPAVNGSDTDAQSR